MPRQSPRYRVTATQHNAATLHTTDHMGDPITREFWAPSSGGYVHEITDSRPGTSGQQVCEGLRTTGNTLRWSGRIPLAGLIRREARAYYPRTNLVD